MHSLIHGIENRLADPAVRFVFPSEVTAAFWRKEVVRATPYRAVRSDRFISWDVFKEHAFARTHERQPANRTVRMWFAAGLLSTNESNGPLIRYLVNPSFARDWQRYVRPVSRVLPVLKSVRDATSGGALDLSADAAADIAVLADHYEEFLDEHGYFEPNFEEVGRIAEDAGAERTVIAYPEVIEDYGQFSEVLNAAGVEVIPTPSVSNPVIREFDNAHLELKYVFSGISAILSDGGAADDIVITVPGLAHVSERLREEADLYSVPIHLRHGRSLADYPVNRLFSGLSAVVADERSLESFRAVLLDRAVPWKDRRMNRKLVDFGVRHHCLRAYRDGKRSVDPWRERLASHGDAILQNYYGRLSGSIDRIVRATSFADLRAGLNQFIRDFLNTRVLPEDGKLEHQTALDALGELEVLELGLGPPPGVEPFQFFLTVLGDRPYVRRPDRPSVPVYDYRVSAGLEPRHHFVLNADHRATLVRTRRFPFLPENMYAQGAGAEIDLTEPFLSLYACSGRNTYMSFSRESFDGPSLPPVFFLERGSVLPAAPGAAAAADPYDVEPAVWTVPGTVPERLHSIQREGALRAAVTAFSPSRGGPIDGSLRHDLLARVTTEDGLLQISPSSLDQFTDCPFSFLLDRLLYVRETEYAVSPSDPRIIGELYHRILAAFFRTVLESDAPTLHADREHYAAEMHEIIDRVASSFRDEVGVFVPPAWAAIVQSVHANLESYLDLELKEYAGCSVVDVECDSSAERPGIYVHGRIDRLSRGEDGYIVVDYKKRARITSPSLDPETGRIDSFQIPVYILLAQEAYGTVAEAVLIDLEKTKLVPVYRTGGAKSWKTRDQVEQLVRCAEDAMQVMAGALRAGEFGTPASVTGCESCSFRGVCREKYAVG